MSIKYNRMANLFTAILFCILTIEHSSCNEPCNGGAKCIPVRECSELQRQQTEQGPNSLYVLLFSKLYCGMGDNKMIKVCCPPEYLSTSPRSISQGDLQVENMSTSLLPNSSVCGVHYVNRMFGGFRADLDEHPWLALLRIDKPSRRYTSICGGVLISARYVLTAAHCVKGLPTKWKLSQVRLGEWNVTSDLDCLGLDCSPPVVDVPVEEVIAHELYDTDDENQQHDIALLRLSHNVTFTEFIKPICLPPSSDEILDDKRIHGTDLEVAGWGKTDTRSSSDVKLKGNLAFVSQETCQRVYSRVNRKITKDQICVGARTNMEHCRGDSGGPLMQFFALGQWSLTVVGVSSYGPEPCGIEGWPKVYTKVSPYKDWILSKIRP